MLDKLRKDYDQALSEFRTRSAEDAQQRQQLANQQITATNMALLLAESTQSTATENATLTFLREHAQELAQHDRRDAHPQCGIAGTMPGAAGTISPPLRRS